MPGTIAWARTATAAIVASTRPTASSASGRASAASSCGDAYQAAENSSGGRKTRNTMSGSSSRSGNPGVSPIARPPSTSTIGNGTWMNSARRTHTAAAASSRITNSMSPTDAGTLGSAARARPPRSPARPRRPRPGTRRRAARARHVRRLPVPVLHGRAADPHARPPAARRAAAVRLPALPAARAPSRRRARRARRARRPRRRTRSGRCTTRSTGCAAGWGSRTSSARRAASGSTPTGSGPTWTPAHAERVRRDVESALATGVGGTPTFFVGGLRHEGAFDVQSLMAALEAG